MAEEKRVVELSDFEPRLLVNGLADFRNDLIRDEKPTEDVNDLNQKVVYILGGFLVTNEIVSEVCQPVHQKPVFKV